MLYLANFFFFFFFYSSFSSSSYSSSFFFFFIAWYYIISPVLNCFQPEDAIFSLLFLLLHCVTLHIFSPYEQAFILMIATHSRNM